MTWRTDDSGTCEQISAEWCFFVGRSTASQLGHGWLGCVHPKDRERLSVMLPWLLAQRVSFFIEYRLRHHTGSYVSVTARGHVLVADGHFSGHYGVVSERASGLTLKEAGHLIVFRARQKAASLAQCHEESGALIERK